MEPRRRIERILCGIGGVVIGWGGSSGTVSTADLPVRKGVTNGEGAGVTFAGHDMDGDGATDLVVGAPYNDLVGSETGIAYILFGG